MKERSILFSKNFSRTPGGNMGSMSFFIGKSTFAAAALFIIFFIMNECAFSQISSFECEIPELEKSLYRPNYDSSADFERRNDPFFQDATETIYRGSLLSSGTRITGVFYRMEPKYKGNKFFTDPLSAYGAIIGYEKLYKSGCNFGIFYNYGFENSVKTVAFDSKTNNHLLGLKYRQTLGAFTVLLEGSAGYDLYSYSYSYDGVDGKIKEDGYQGRGYAEVSYNNLSLYGISLKPFVAYQYDFLQRNALEDDSLAFSDKIKHDSSQMLFGARLSWNCIHARFAWVHDFEKGESPIRSQWLSSFPGVITPNQLYYDGNSGVERYWLGVGFQYKFLNCLVACLDYDLVYNSKETSHIGSVGLRLCW